MAWLLSLPRSNTQILQCHFLPAKMPRTRNVPHRGRGKARGSGGVTKKRVVEKEQEWEVEKILEKRETKVQTLAMLHSIDRGRCTVPAEVERLFSQRIDMGA